MEGRCVVETWAEFGSLGTSCTPKIKFGRDVFICSGSDEVFVFSIQERKLTAVLQFPSPVSDLVESHDKQLLYVACRSGVYCVSFQLLLSRAQGCRADSSSTPAELKISSEFLLVAEEGVSLLLLVGSVLLTLSQTDTSWTLTLYNSPEQSVSGSCEQLRSFSLPLVSGVVHKTGMRRRPVLLCVRSGDSSSSSDAASMATLTDGHILLEPTLFGLLFGIDAALAKSPVIVCGLPDGCLSFLALRLPGSQLRILNSLEQPVVFVGAAVMETGQGHAQYLVAVGEFGRVMLVKADKRGPEGGDNIAAFIDGSVPGPVMCVSMDKTHLYYSTGSDLLALDLSEGSTVGQGLKSDEDTTSKAAAVPQSLTSLNVCRVIAFAGPTCSSAGEVQLLVLSDRGQLQRITLPVKREGEGLSKVSSTQVGRSVKDLLSAIGDVCERASALKTAIKSRNQNLRHLNQVLNISFLLKANTKNEEHRDIQEMPIRCHAMTSWCRLLQKDSLNLTCFLDNSSPYVLEHGWTLSVTVFPLSCLSAGGESSSTNFSFPFHNLHPGETLEVSLPLADAGDSSFPMTVSCSLIFSLSSLLGEDEANLSGSEGRCISLPLNTLTVDWLHSLQVNSPIAAQKKATSRSSDITTDTIQAFLSSRRTRHNARGHGGGESASKSEREQYSARVRVSSELLRDTLGLRSTDLDTEGVKLAPQSVCLSLLEWLLSGGAGGVKIRHQGDKLPLSNPVIHARVPNGHMVKVTAKEVNVEETLSVVEVQVESASIAAVCGLHHAILWRVQTLLQKAPQKAGTTKSFQTLGLRQALHRAEHLSQQIQQIKISGAVSVGVSTGRMTRSLLGVYRELRENSLLII